MAIEGMNTRWAYQLAASGSISMEDVAEQAIDDLIEREEMAEAVGGEMIMTVREPWFE